MRINRIKLSGFKSFVDPTTLTLPGNLTGVVGPNGCGKSNIIDALIWVMGESSAKHLRGESMADVIFNGSNTRKPVGQSTVEIVFDNTDGTIGGQYAGFGEISIKRTISRDGLSSYFLNGSRCRRKDITNVFLGTGIGSRGYSVIEQGMISRVIEARPEELRGFLEEAAGISKYKERRRETENRMRHTEENIERLDDIREELDKQLNHLQRQARAAERYQVMKADERRLEARLLAVRWRTLDAERSQARQLTEQRSNELEAEVARLREVEAQQTGYREAQAEATEAFNAVQAEFYARSGDISRLEQAIRHADEREQALAGDLAETRRALEELDRGIEGERGELESTSADLAADEPRFATSRDTEAEAYEALRAVEARFAQWQNDWDAFNHEHTELAQREHAARIRLEHLLEDIADHDTRRTSLSAEADRNETGDLSARIAEDGAELEQRARARDDLITRLNAVRANLAQSRGAAQTLNSALHERQVELEEQRGRLASLRALQENAYGDDQESIERWMEQHGFSDAARLAEYVDIEPGWETALEAALRIPLGALCGDGLQQRVLSVSDGGRPGGAVTVIDRRTGPGATPADPALLAARVSGAVDLGPLLQGVYAAEDLATARELRARIGAHELVVLRDGTLLGANWARLAGAGDSAESILGRERNIAALAAQIEKHEADTDNLRSQRDNAQQRLATLEQEQHELGEQIESATRDVNARRDALAQMEAEFQRRQARSADVLAELERLATQSQENEQAVAAVRAERDSAARALAGHAERREALAAARNAIQQEVDTARERWRELRDATHALELRINNLRARRESLEQAAARNAGSREQLVQRGADMEKAIAELEGPRAQMRSELEQVLEHKLTAENKLTEARQALGSLDESMQNAARRRVEIEQAISERQQRLEQVRLDQRALDVRLQELASRFAQTGEDLDQTVAALAAEDNEAAVEAEIERLANRIARLGPINLAAIDEFNQLTERKTYLDQQHGDLIEALTTLQDAIRKIDRETRTRFKETYDKVNNGLQAMFPVLFGGGHAYLELTGDDLLETGVTVMARPPGKRNSTIHLLSGGEKALTALSFVFSIFELNPAPFCLLDEVDAPLDDANVVRLTEMLKSMAGSVQFLFVTHNKITMEIAEQLIGVTMQEAGVSRLVSVNMEEAVELAATA